MGDIETGQCTTTTTITTTTTTTTTTTIIEMLNFIKAPKWIIGWLKEAMRTWRTILQVKEGKQFKLSREIEIDCGIFQGDSLSPHYFA